MVTTWSILYPYWLFGVILCREILWQLILFRFSFSQKSEKNYYSAAIYTSLQLCGILAITGDVAEWIKAVGGIWSNET